MSKKNRQKKWKQRKQQSVQKAQRKGQKRKTWRKSWYLFKRKMRKWMMVLIGMVVTTLMWIIEHYDSIKSISTDIAQALSIS